MITPYLESLIHEGKAFMTMHSHGASGYGTINVNDNEYIIITDIYIHGFDNPPELTDEGHYVSHSLVLQSKTSRNLIATRSDLTRTMQHFDVYFIHGENVSIVLNNMLPPDIWNVGDTVPPITAQELPAPIGHGGEISIRTVEFNSAVPTDTYKPLGSVRDPKPAVTKLRNQFITDLTPLTKINDPLITLKQKSYTYPIINFSYITIRGTLPASIIGSK